MEAKKNIGFLPQKPPLYSDHTVDEFLTFAAEMRLVDPKKIKQAVEMAKERCGIAHFSKRLIRNLSGGYQQRLGIAQAIIHNPAFVVLDEPTNGLDPNQIVEIRHLIKEIAEERTVVLSTHILTEVQATCDYIRMIEQGSLVFAGTVREFDNYITPTSVVVSLLSMPPIDDLRSLPGIVSVEELGGTKYRLQFVNAQEMMEKVVEISNIRGWRLNEIYLEKSSLDAIFAELSKK